MKKEALQEIVLSPTDAWLKAQLQHCHKRLWIVSPYVTEALCTLIAPTSHAPDRRLLTCLRTKNFTQRSSSIDALWNLLYQNIDLYHRDNLHAKIYLIDHRVALVTSANATNGGLRNNVECGIATRDPDMIGQIEEQIKSGFNAQAQPPERIKDKHLNTLEGKILKHYQQKHHQQKEEAAKPPLVDEHEMQAHRALHATPYCPCPAV